MNSRVSADAAFLSISGAVLTFFSSEALDLNMYAMFGDVAKHVAMRPGLVQTPELAPSRGASEHRVLPRQYALLDDKLDAQLLVDRLERILDLHRGFAVEQLEAVEHEREEVARSFARFVELD